MRMARRTLALILASLAVLLSACSGSHSDKSGYTFIMITHETAGDVFWDRIKAGAQQAADNTGTTLKYFNDPNPVRQAGLIDTAVSEKVDGIATTLASPDVLSPSVHAARDAGIPVVAFNAGGDAYQSAGALMYFGSDDRKAGDAAGVRIAAAGGQRPLCVIHAPDHQGLRDRCDGVKAHLPATQIIEVNGSDDAAVTSVLAAKLAGDPGIDYVVTLGAPIAFDAIKAQGAAGTHAKIVTFDLNADVAKQIKTGDIEFAIDQQPYVQGYLAVTSLYLYKKNGNDIGGGEATLTGPSFVDSSNIDVILPFAEANTR